MAILRTDVEAGIPYRNVIGFTKDPIDIRRLSNFTNDNVSGVSLNFNLSTNTYLC